MAGNKPRMDKCKCGRWSVRAASQPDGLCVTCYEALPILASTMSYSTLRTLLGMHPL